MFKNEFLKALKCLNEPIRADLKAKSHYLTIRIVRVISRYVSIARIA